MKTPATLDDRVLDLWETGMTTRRIASACDCSVLDVERVVDRGRYRGDPRAAARSRGPRRRRQLSVPAALVDRLEADAGRRGLSVHALAELLMLRIASDRMVDAILDDGGQP